MWNALNNITFIVCIYRVYRVISILTPVNVLPLLSLSQFLAVGCENCPFLDLMNDEKKINSCCSMIFDG